MKTGIKKRFDVCYLLLDMHISIVGKYVNLSEKWEIIFCRISWVFYIMYVEQHSI